MEYPFISCKCITYGRVDLLEESIESFIKVRHSIHGNGVFAARKIPTGARIIEYRGKRITEKQAEKRFGQDPDNPYHTFFFSLDSGKLIDGGDEGNDARWINHSCEPNVRAVILKGHILYLSKRWIEAGEELTIDYHFPKDVERVACKCGAEKCRGTINVK